MSTGTLACTVKEGVKLYVYNMRSSHVEKARNLAIEQAIHDAMQQGISAKDVAKQAQKEGAKAAKLATRKTKRIVGPIISSGWDFFEAVYYGGTITEGFLRGTGTLFGAYAGGFYGEQGIGRVGYLLGSHLGSWIGGRIGLMVYDVVSGLHYLVTVVETIDGETENDEKADAGESYSYEDPPAFEGNEGVIEEGSSVYESPMYESSESESHESPSTFWL
ncbi:unnamed protein product [Linum trigynum]